MAKGFILSEEDAASFREMVSWFRSFKRLPKYDPMAVDHEEHPTPEVHVAVTPEGGIPGLLVGPGTGSGDEPGSAQCQVYRIWTDTGELHPVSGLVKTVYNLSSRPICPGQRVRVQRDKFGIWFVAEHQKGFWAVVANRHKSTCSTQGLTGTSDDETIYTYFVHSVREVIDGVGCITRVPDEPNVATTGYAWERNNNLVAVGTIVWCEWDQYADETYTGTGDEPVGCRIMFKHDSTEPEAPCLSKYRYFCVAGVLKEYDEDCNGVLTYLRDVGCCECFVTGTGSVHDDCDVCVDTSDKCIHIGVTNPWPDQPGYQCGNYPEDITVSCVGTTAGVQRWEGIATDNLGQSWTGVLTVTCGTIYSVSVDRTDTPGACKMDGFIVLDSANACTFPQNVTIKMRDGIGCFGGENPTCQQVVTVSNGACPAETGTGTGDCPCTWHCLGTGWILDTGCDPACNLNPPSGSCSGPGDVGKTASTNLDGSNCSSSDTSMEPTCAECGTNDKNLTIGGGTDGFLVAQAGVHVLAYDAGSDAFYGPAFTTGCGSSTRWIMWCEDDHWYLTLEGSNQAFGVDAAYPNTCNDLRFTTGGGAASNKFTAANSLCPGQESNFYATVSQG